MNTGGVILGVWLGLAFFFCLLLINLSVSNLCLSHPHRSADEELPSARRLRTARKGTAWL